MVGKDSLSAVVEFVTTGNFQALTYRFLRPVFNALVESDGDLAFVASVTNAIAVSLFVLLVFFRAGYRGGGVDATGIAMTGLIILLVLLLNARSVLVVAMVSVLFSAGVRLVIKRGMTALDTIAVGIGILCLLGVALFLSSGETAAVDSVLSMFTFEDNSTQSRIEQIGWAADLIERNIIAGNGYMETESGLPVHNLFLSSWAYVGLLGFLPVLVFYGGLVVIWARSLWVLMTRPDRWVLRARPEWVCVLPVLPMFRVWVSGGGGHLAFGEWVALGVFIGLTMRNADERRNSQFRLRGLLAVRPAG
jgi:hypothetical protein